MAFLDFVNNTQYKTVNSEQDLAELLLADLIDLKEVYFVEQRVLKDTIEAQDRLNKGYVSMDKAAENQDFVYLLESQSRKEISQTVKGDFLPVEDVQIIGKRYGADYILHGTMDFLGSQKEIKTDLVPLLGVEKTKFKIIAVGTLRVIDARNGEVVWVCRDKGISIDRHYSSDKLSIGYTSFSEPQVTEALIDLSKNLAKNMKKSIKDKKLALKK